ncbi:MAG: hypothetical protein ACI83I_000424 [Bacteroidia bacterium]|jgi:hypothetical protein
MNEYNKLLEIINDFQDWLLIKNQYTFLANIDRYFEYASGKGNCGIFHDHINEKILSADSEFEKLPMVSQLLSISQMLQSSQSFNNTYCTIHQDNGFMFSSLEDQLVDTTQEKGEHKFDTLMHSHYKIFLCVVNDILTVLKFDLEFDIAKSKSGINKKVKTFDSDLSSNEMALFARILIDCKVFAPITNQKETAKHLSYLSDIGQGNIDNWIQSREKDYGKLKHINIKHKSNLLDKLHDVIEYLKSLDIKHKS